MDFLVNSLFTSESSVAYDRGLSCFKDFNPNDDEVDRYFDIPVSYDNLGQKEDNFSNQRLWLTNIQGQEKFEFQIAVQEIIMIKSLSLPSKNLQLTFKQQYPQQREKTEIKKRLNKVPKPVSRFYNKNICRYIENHAISTLITEIHREDVIKICNRHLIDYQNFKDYYLQHKSQMQGVQLLKNHLKIIQSDSPTQVKRKQTFQSYLVWYLDNLATRHIITRLNKSDVRQYLSYKNYVMTYFIRCSNAAHIGNELPEWAKRN